jgi:hypothetical protein
VHYDEDKIVPDNLLDGVPKAIEALQQVVDPLDITPAETTTTDPYVKAPTVPPGIGPPATTPRAGRACPSPHLTSPHLTSPHLTSPHLTSQQWGEAMASVMGPSGEGMPARCFLAHRDCEG